MKGVGARAALSLAFLAVAPHVGSAQSAALYFDQPPPGDTPVVFAPGVISRDDRYEQFLLYSPDGRELVFSITNSDWSAFTLQSLRFENGAWSEPETPGFLGGDPDGLVACFTRDMRRAFFTSARPAWPPGNIWMSERGEDGWAEPAKLGPPISSDADEWEVAIADNGTLYFSSAREGGYGDLDIYRARLVDGGYPAAENLGPPINTAAGDDLPYIAPDESYLIFASNRDGGLGERDLYVSFARDGGWSEPLGLGPEINTAGFDIYPFVSADGKYLFFTRRKAWVTDEDSDVYWVSARVIDRLREVAAARPQTPPG